MILELMSSSSSSDDEMIQELTSFKTKISKINNFLDIVKEYSYNEVIIIIYISYLWFLVYIMGSK